MACCRPLTKVHLCVVTQSLPHHRRCFQSCVWADACWFMSWLMMLITGLLHCGAKKSVLTVPWYVINLGDVVVHVFSSQWVVKHCLEPITEAGNLGAMSAFPSQRQAMQEEGLTNNVSYFRITECCLQNLTHTETQAGSSRLAKYDMHCCSAWTTCVTCFVLDRWRQWVFLTSFSACPCDSTDWRTEQNVVEICEMTHSR